MKNISLSYGLRFSFEYWHDRFYSHFEGTDEEVDPIRMTIRFKNKINEGQTVFIWSPLDHTFLHDAETDMPSKEVLDDYFEETFNLTLQER